MQILKRIHFSEIDSTNSRALRELEDGTLTFQELPALISAERQTAGRGQHSHTWHSPKGCLMFTLLFRPKDFGIALSQTPLLSFASALSVLESLAKVLSPKNACRLAIHWPNDVFWLENPLEDSSASLKDSLKVSMEASLALPRKDSRCLPRKDSRCLPRKDSPQNHHQEPLSQSQPQYPNSPAFQTFPPSRKLSGILLEGHSSGIMAAGIGINLFNSFQNAPQDLREIALSLAELEPGWETSPVLNPFLEKILLDTSRCQSGEAVKEKAEAETDAETDTEANGKVNRKANEKAAGKAETEEEKPNQAKFPPEMEAFLRLLLTRLNANFRLLAQNPREIVRRTEARCVQKGTYVSLQTPRGIVSGFCTGLDPSSGSLLVDGKPIRSGF